MSNKSGVSLQWAGMDKRMGAAAKHLAKRKVLLKAVGEALKSSSIQRFAAGEGPSGQKWPASKRAQSQGGQTLVDTARLRDSIATATTNDIVLVGSNLAYARIHQLGGKAGRGRKVNIPARPYLGVSNEDKAEIAGTIADYLRAAFKGN